MNLIVRVTLHEYYEKDFAFSYIPNAMEFIQTLLTAAVPDGESMKVEVLAMKEDEKCEEES